MTRPAVPRPFGSDTQPTMSVPVPGCSLGSVIEGAVDTAKLDRREKQEYEVLTKEQDLEEDERDDGKARNRSTYIASHFIASMAIIGAPIQSHTVRELICRQGSGSRPSMPTVVGQELLYAAE